MAEMLENPHYLAAKQREIPPEKRLRRRKDGDFRDVDDMHTANYYFEDGNETSQLKKIISNIIYRNA